MAVCKLGLHLFNLVVEGERFTVFGTKITNENRTVFNVSTVVHTNKLNVLDAVFTDLKINTLIS